MDSLFNILSTKEFSEPEEAAKLKAYIKDKYGMSVGVQIRDKDIVLIVKSSSAASSLRLNGQTIKHELDINKKLSFRING
ncbi:MAG TPA: hypothetical protein VFN31_01630 [Candidatus Saccharimonadales bacterium]|nr:hypothetical protein [Candidatus Saccharimonadales bacterium]